MTQTAVHPDDHADVHEGGSAARERRGPSPRKLWRNVPIYVVLIVVAIFVVLPLVWVLMTSFKTDADALMHPASLIPHPFTMQAYRSLASSGQEPIYRWFLNSLAAGAIQTVLILVVASMAAYALARLDFAGKNAVFGMLVVTLMVPGVVFLVPDYVIVEKLGWLNSLWAITIPGASGAFGVFFLRQFMIGLPMEIEEAARIDGAGSFRIFLNIILPLSRPALATLAVLSFLSNWNDFLWPVYVLLTPTRLTLQPGLSVLQGAYSTHFGIVMAGAVIAAVPVLILYGLAQRHIIDGIATGALKG